MNLAKSVFKNVSYLLIARTAFRFLTAIALIYAARYLGTERYGMFEIATAWANMFLALNDVGMSMLIVREAARDPKSTAVYFGNTLFVETILSIVLFFVIIGIGFGFHYDHTTIMLMAIIAASNLLFEFRKVMRGVFRVNMSMRTVAMTEILNGALFFVGVMAIVLFVDNPDYGLLGIAHTSLWVDFVTVALLFLLTIKLVRPKIDFTLIWPMIKKSYVFTLYNMFFMLYFQIDQIMISVFMGKSEVGIYSAAAKLVTVLLFIPLMTFQVTMPLMYKYSKDDIEKYKRINHTIWRYLCAFGIPAGIGLWFLAPEIIPFVYGPEYLSSIIVLQIFGWFLAIRFIGISQGNSLTTTDRQGLRTKIQLFSILVNIVLDVILINKYGVAGAAIATVITEACITISAVVLSARFLQESLLQNFRSIIPIIAATAGMLGILILAKPFVSVIVLVLLGMIIYCLLLWIFRFFQEYDRQIFKQIISKKSSNSKQ